MSTDEHALSLPVEDIYQKHHSWLNNWLVRRLACRADAADLAQDTFLRLISRPRKLDVSKGVRGYLTTIAKGLCVDLWRRREIEQAWLQCLSQLPEPDIPSAEYSALILDALTEIDSALRTLSDNAYLAFVMSVVAGMTDKEVAAELGVSDRMVRKYLTQAMIKFAHIEAQAYLRHGN